MAIMKNVTYLGLGRIGLPQALVAADKGFRVYGLESNRHILDKVKEGIPPFYEPGLEELLEKNLHRNFIPKHVDELHEVVPISDYVILTIGTGNIDYQRPPDLTNLFSLVEAIFQLPLKDKVTVILRVTVPLGVTDEIRLLIETKFDLKEGEDFYLVFVPERLAEGYAIAEEQALPKIVGAYSSAGFESAKAFFAKIGGKVIRVCNPKAAELSKLVDNSFRNTLFAFANELAFLAVSENLDVIEIIRACNEDYPRNFISVPGPVSGYCLGKDSHILEISFEKIRAKRGFNSVWFYARQANNFLIEYIVDAILGELQTQGMVVNPNILVMGLSFKQNIDDYRFSHSIEIIRRLRTVLPAVRISVYDPNLDATIYAKLPDDIAQAVDEKFTYIDPAIFSGKNVIIVATQHRELTCKKSLKTIRELMQKAQKPVILYDCWNIWREAAKLEGVIYLGLGCPRVTKQP